MKYLWSVIVSLRPSRSSDFSSLRGLINERDELILRAESNLTTIGSYGDQLEERLASFAVAWRNTAVREYSFANSGLEMSQMGLISTPWR